MTADSQVCVAVRFKTSSPESRAHVVGDLTGVLEVHVILKKSRMMESSRLQRNFIIHLAVMTQDWVR